METIASNGSSSQCAGAHVLEKLAREDEEALRPDEVAACAFRVGVAQRGVTEVRIARRALVTIDVGRKVFGDVAVEQHAQDILLEVPSVHAPAQVVGDAPDRPVKLRPLLLLDIQIHHPFLRFNPPGRRFFP